jgi:SOS-response transcriptional repressor LexA
MVFDGNKYIKKKRIERGWSIRKAAGIAGISDAALGDIEKGNEKGVNPSTNTLRKICDGWSMSHEYMYVLLLFGHVRPEDLISKITEPSSGKPLNQLPVYRYVAAGVFEQMLNTEAVETIQTIQDDAEAFALKIQGKSMSPVFKDGQIIVVSPNTPIKDGDYVVVIDEKNKTGTFKKYAKLNEDIYILKPLNDEFNDMVIDKKFHKHHKIVGVVVETVTKYR